jgi:aminodeoxyfutalosine synthase
VTPFLSQTALAFGVDDLEGTVVREKIYHEAGARTAQGMSLEAILRLIRGAGRVPVERDSFYRVVRTFDDEPGSRTTPVGTPRARGSAGTAVASAA